MSDHESENNPTSDEVESEPAASFSSNGNDSSGVAMESEGFSGEGADESNAFLANLARAMQSTAAAEQTRNAEGTEQRRQTHIDSIRAREALEAEELRELAKQDVTGIDAWSDGEIKRIKLERERRIAARREQLQVRLEEHRAVVAREVEAVEAAVATYRADIEQYFRRLETEKDPVAIAKQAGSRPAFPALELIGPGDSPVTSNSLSDSSAPVDASEAGVPAQSKTDSGIGVMDPAANGQTADTPWKTPSEAVPAEAIAADEPGEASAPNEDSTPADKAGESEGEPVAAVAEARVVMPRSTGAGSWLRWPNSGNDRSDSSR